MIRPDEQAAEAPFWRTDWRSVAVFFMLCALGEALMRIYAPSLSGLDPTGALALAFIYFSGFAFILVAYAALLSGAVLAGAPLALSLIAQSLTVASAALGARILRTYRVDPLFRRYRDTFIFLCTMAIVAFSGPARAYVHALYDGMPSDFAQLEHAYAASLTAFLIVTPLLLRWLAKPRFSRRPVEVLEVVLVFGSIGAILVMLFVGNVRALFGIPLSDLLLIPLFWTALRLRPRFLTLALFLATVFALVHALAGPATELAARLFSAELGIITIGTSFFIIVSLEEDRRVNNNLMRNQLATSENAMARIASESRAKNEFIAILAHELRNPLAPIMTSIDLLRIQGAHDPEFVATLAMMADRMDTVRHLLDDLLDISRIEEGKLEIAHAQVDMGSVLRRAILSTEHYRAERHQALREQGSAEGVMVRGDAVRLEQVFSNLLTNASKYSAPGSRITCSIRAGSDQVEIGIADTGIGIAPEALEYIFLPFQQLSAGKRTQKGLGIGLALVKNFVTLHGGTVEAKSAGEGKGSRFVVTLPIIAPETGAASHETPITPFKAHNEPRILVVDDNDAAAAGIGRLLEFMGCVVSYAYDGRQALERTLAENPDLVLLDVGLPDEDGYAVAKKIRAQGWRGRLVAHTGYSTDVREKGAPAGFDEYLIKPAGYADLRTIVSRLSGPPSQDTAPHVD